MRYDEACDALDRWKFTLEILIDRQLELKRAVVKLKFSEDREAEARAECEKIMKEATQ